MLSRHSPYPPLHVRLVRHLRFVVWPVVWRLLAVVGLLLLSYAWVTWQGV